MRRWAQAKAGEGCAVLISGEPGIGKSRIAEAIQERLGAELHTMRGRSVEYEEVSNRGKTSAENLKVQR